jgi:hypothetical protein
LPLDPDYRDAKNGLSVKLTKVKKNTIGNVTTVEIAYTLRNDTPNLIMEDYWKLYYKGEGGEPQYGSHGNRLPGETRSRSYTFQVQSPDIPSVLGYPADFLLNLRHQTS